MLGTNPMTWGMPTDEDFPFMLDCATSVTQRGKLELYERIGKELPDGWVIGEDGQYRNDTAQVLKDLTKDKAALTPLGGLGEELGGYKGYGYACVVEMLSSALSQADYMKMLMGVTPDGTKCPIKLGHFFMAINIECFLDLKDFKKHTGDVNRALRASRKAPGAERIYTPGEKAHEAQADRLKNGVPVEEKTLAELREIAAELGIEGV